ncbi:hypothetical protein KJ611_01715 [Patescibacteria group bacterium]|nr:hypothetical protein [Patescibacteria group bacterium]MBU1705139.1 hypothetical protein [Patescibacteria group bacterium]
MSAKLEAYCVKCQKNREMMDSEKVKIPIKGGQTRPAWKGVCAVCGTGIHLFITK